MASVDRYSMSFTTGTLLHFESVKIAEIYVELKDWRKVRAQVLENNLIQAKTDSALRRMTREAMSRLKYLADDELSFLAATTYQDQAYLLWIAICRRYSFIGDFAKDVLHEHHITFNERLTHQNYEAFYNSKAAWYEEVERVTPRTQQKLRQVVFKMMREADLLTDDGFIRTALATPAFFKLIVQHNAEDLRFLPISADEIRRMIA